MALRREILLSIGSLVLLNLLLAFGAIGLFVRMGPVIEHIFQENVLSIVAAEEMLSELAKAGGEPLMPEARARLRTSLTEAQRNVTEDDERPVLASLERRLPAAMDGEAQARRQVIDDLGQVIHINREAMRSVDEEARRLGTAGAWAAVLIGFVSFLLSVLVVVRLQSRFVRPLEDLHKVLQSARRGDSHRRCRHVDAPREVEQVSQEVNRLLDERLQHRRSV